MIQSKYDLKRYILQDMERNQVAIGGGKNWIKIHANPRLWFQYNLRYYEYYHNTHHNLWGKIMELFHYVIHKHLSYKLGFTIYVNNFGPGLFIAHYGTIVVNKTTRIGKNCTINVDVNIGMRGGVIGDNVYIAPGVKIIKPIHVGNNVKIGANAVVTKDIPDNCVVAGVPARIIKYIEPNGK